MPRRERPPHTTSSEHWLRVAANESAPFTDARIRQTYGWPEDEDIEWRSPLTSDAYAEYYDEAFLDRLGVHDLNVPLDAFWPRSGPRWDGLVCTSSGKLLLVEAKAYPEESVDFGSKAGSVSLKKIHNALDEAKTAFRARKETDWYSPYYQYANRLAHLHFLAGLNGLDAYLLFLCFANAPDLGDQPPATKEEWKGTVRILEKSLGLGARHPYRNRVATLIVDVGEMQDSSKS